MGEPETRETVDCQARIISLAEAAKILNVSYPTAVRLAKSGELKAFRIRSTWRTSNVVCDEFIRQQFKLQADRCELAQGD